MPGPHDRLPPISVLRDAKDLKAALGHLVRPPDLTAPERAFIAMHEGRWPEARAILEELVQISPLAVLFNNLATVHFLGEGDPGMALAVLAPNFEPQSPLNPYAHALAARCHRRLGDQDAARRHLAQAVEEFSAGLQDPNVRREGASRSWREYSTAILLASAEIEDDGAVLAHYRRWQDVHGHPQAHFLGGVASFNRRRYAAAQKIWARLDARDWSFLAWYDGAAALLEAGRIPPYRLDYDVPSATPKTHADFRGRLQVFLDAAKPQPETAPESLKAETEAAVADPALRTLLLFVTFIERAPAWSDDNAATLEGLVRFGGAWGRDLAAMLQSASGVPEPVRRAASSGLSQAPRFAPSDAAAPSVAAEPPGVPDPRAASRQPPAGEA